MTMPSMKEALKLYEETLDKRREESSRFKYGRAKGQRIIRQWLLSALKLLHHGRRKLMGRKLI